jgi:DNA-directed RNA polymerase subunit RPC12/RpoP
MLKTTDATEDELEHISSAIEKEFRETWDKAKGGLRKLQTQALQRPVHKLMNEARSILKDVSGKVKTAAGELENGLDKSMASFSGDMVESGTFVCKRCGKEIHLPFPANLPECSECGGNVFRRGGNPPAVAP